MIIRKLFLSFAALTMSNVHASETKPISVEVKTVSAKATGLKKPVVTAKTAQVVMELRATRNADGKIDTFCVEGNSNEPHQFALSRNIKLIQKEH